MSQDNANPLRLFWTRWNDFNGLSSRAEFWPAFIIFIIPIIGLQVYYEYLSQSTRWNEEQVIIVLSLLMFYCIIVFIPVISLKARRLHDANYSGYWLMLSFIPFIGLILLILLALPSVHSGNRYANNSESENAHTESSGFHSPTVSKHSLPAQDVHKKVALTEKQRVLLEYDEEAKSLYDEVSSLGGRWAQLFLQTIEDAEDFDPKLAFEQVIREYDKENSPFDSDEINEIYRQLQARNENAAKEFATAIRTLGTRANVREIHQKILAKLDYAVWNAEGRAPAAVSGQANAPITDPNQNELESLKKALNLNGYRTTSSGDKFRVAEPLGGRTRWMSEAVFRDYASSRT
jgi:uncharacterized membrane protein YhaH (DUF805 family)